MTEQGGWLYYNASPTNATQQYLWRTRLDGKGSAERLAPASQSGGHYYTMSPDAKYAFHSWATFDSPGPTELVSLPTHRVERTLDGWMIRPKDFDASKRYPLRKAVNEQIGVLSSRQQAQAVQALARTRSYVDPTRVGIWGWSGGGSSTLQALFRYPDVYQVGMSVAPVPDQRLYDTIHQERYMGLLGPNAAKYDAASPIGQAKGLRGKLLIVHGSGDDNVHYQGTERMINALVALNKPVDFMVYPKRTHSMSEGEGTTLHVYSLLSRYLMEHLPAGGRGVVP